MQSISLWKTAFGITPGYRAHRVAGSEFAGNPWFIPIGTLVVLLLLRSAAMVWTPLVPEEAYYWLYAQHPSLSYYDHPPMVAWCIGLGTWLFGNSEFGVRIVGSMMMLASSLLLYRAARLWFGRRASLVAAISLQVLPFYFGLGYIATMDSALAFFWLLCMLGVSLALKRNQIWGWYLAGIALGGAGLAKYSAMFLGIGVLAALVVHRPWRRHLRSIHPHASLLLAIVVFMPVVIWNAQNGWASFRFQFVDRYASSGFSMDKPLWFAAVQVMVLTPVLLAVAWVILVRWLRRPRRLLAPRVLFALAFSVPLLAAALQKSFSYEVHINWTAPAFLSLLPLIGNAVAGLWRGCRVRWRRAIAGSFSICAGVNILAMTYLLLLQPYLHWPRPFGPWRELATVVEDIEDRLQDQTRREPLIVGDGKYRLASVLAFYRTPLEKEEPAAKNTTSQWIATRKTGLGFEYWLTRAECVGRDCVIASDDPQLASQLAGRFDAIEVVKDPRLALCAPYRVIIGYGLRP